MLKKILLGLMVCLVSIAGKAVDFPALTGQVIDEAGILTQATKNSILSTMTPDQQFAVVTLKSLRGYEIEEYALALGRHWGIGNKENDDGLLLVVAPNERQVRIEVGYGLENIITDYKANQIIQKYILPAFKQGDYNRGILVGVKALQQTLNGKPLSFESQSSDNGGQQKSSNKRNVFHNKTLIFIMFSYFNAFLFILLGCGWHTAKKIKEGDEKILKRYSDRAQNELRLNASKNWRRVNILLGIYILFLIASLYVLIEKEADFFMNTFFWGVIILFLLDFWLMRIWWLLDERSVSKYGYAGGLDFGASSTSKGSGGSFRGGGGFFGGGGASGRW